MYKQIKSYLKKVVPESFLLKNELFFRGMHGQLYCGTKFKCTICKKKNRKFIPMQGDDLLCPFCGSMARNRRLFQILESEYLDKAIEILDFSPSRALFRELKKVKTINYTATDFCGEFMADKKLDITNIAELDETFDLIICYHVLEHITNDSKAISELYRVMKTGGTGIIQTPFKEGDIYEDEAIKSDEERRVHFGQEDHVRVYSVSGLCERLSKAGFHVNPVSYKDTHPTYNGFVDETIIYVTK